MYNRLMSNTPYLNMDTYFKDHSILEDNWKVIKEEIPEYLENLYNDNNLFSVLHIRKYVFGNNLCYFG